MNPRCKSTVILLSLLGAAAATPVQAQNADATFPSKPVRFIVPFPPGGNIDTHARIIGQKLTEAWHQTAIIDNRPGAGGQIGMELATKTAPDGYTLVWAGTSVLAVGPHVYQRLNFDGEKDFIAIIRAVDTQNILVVHPSLPVKTPKELIAFAKARPGALNFASSGSGTISHLAGELFKAMTKTDLAHIPYKGSAPAMTDLLSGQVGIMWDSLTSALPQARAGKLRALAVTGLKRSPSVPELPTMSEAALPGYEVINWLGILAPKGVRREIVVKINADVTQILKVPDVRERMLASGAEAAGSTPDEFAAFIHAESTKWGKIVKSVGVKPE
ncbi:MAG: LacI family transcriptional regulator [Betaproteobacteria bacterium]|nr:LacI family transcriptional regulator [Betaproteobacteria bacterium]